ncbi:TetR/AcrR family transcriptional regulator [Allonocardiopsis opalescens]|uniref:TetR family transcriptional regulator n=1 Tax=Allonocardiopsis opalescens TaxID=1144618 RepID=A0A2T0QCX3_9ACTN|nr:TetR/AcrR family transcriptional regulator [Allonocardiopsis opalescens]PRY01769.1 TetR family transcriptional regulator [Allonocardiopsis opalescens]
MGHREDLLAAAKKCLHELGYARITARDLVAASGTNLASIGYHFGSKEALLNVALIETVKDWADDLERSLSSEIDLSDANDPYQRFERSWERVLESMAGFDDSWAGTFEVLSQARHSPELLDHVADGYEEGRQGIAAWFQSGMKAADEGADRALGGFYLALLIGVMLQRGIDPERAPTAHDLAEALRILTREFHESGPAGGAEPADG